MAMCFQRESVAHIPLTSGPHWVLRPPGTLSVATSLRQPLCTQGAWPEPRVRRPPPHTCHTPHGTGVATDSGDAGAGLRQRRSSGPPHPDWSWGPAADAQPSELQGTPDHAQRLDASPTALCVRGTTLRDTGVSIMCGGSFSIVRVRELEAWPRAALI